MSKTKAGPVSADRLKSFIERIETLIEERKAIQGDIKDVYSEAKGVGYDVATMRKVVALRAMDVADRDEMETLIDVYMHALGDAKRAAVEAMQKGAGTREAARTAGIAVGAASQLRTGVHGIGNGERVHETQNGERDREVDSISDDAGHRSEPSAPADMGNPMSVNADPSLGQRSHIETSQGEQSGTDIFAESANDESCGERLAPLGAKGLADSLTLKTAPSRPHDTHPTCAENAQVGDTRGEARRYPPEISDAQALANLEEVEAAFFLRRDSTRVVALPHQTIASES